MSSAMSMLPLASVEMGTIFMPTMMALAGLVPWALVGMMQICSPHHCHLTFCLPGISIDQCGLHMATLYDLCDVNEQRTIRRE